MKTTYEPAAQVLRKETEGALAARLGGAQDSRDGRRLQPHSFYAERREVRERMVARVIADAKLLARIHREVFQRR